MNKTYPDGQQVYLAFRNVFAGQAAELRRPHKIQIRIAASSHEPQIKELIQKHTSTKVYEVVEDLLKHGIFASTLNAQRRFPGLLPTSSAQVKKGKMPEAGPANEEPEVMKNVTEERQQNVLADEDGKQLQSSSHKGKQKLVPHDTNAQEQLGSASFLYPVRFPFPAQHRLLSKAQAILEEACYAFFQERFPKILERNKWDCAELVELPKWKDAFLNLPSEFGAHEFQYKGYSLSKFFDSFAWLRNTAVHRERVDTKQTQNFLFGAECFAHILKREPQEQALQHLRRKCDFVLEEWNLQKKQLEQQAKAAQTEYARREKENVRDLSLEIERVKEEDKINEKVAEEMLTQAVQEAEKAGMGAADTETKAAVGHMEAAEAEVRPASEARSRSANASDNGSVTDVRPGTQKGERCDHQESFARSH
ncbi:MAG: hypothetical protein M1821_008045 [Bathelium mastoideum]|nr:MAG: hypothetical protein M1821_008045 [Bathelium mastoideum]